MCLGIGGRGGGAIFTALQMEKARGGRECVLGEGGGALSLPCRWRKPERWVWDLSSVSELLSTRMPLAKSLFSVFNTFSYTACTDNVDMADSTGRTHQNAVEDE